MASVNHDRYARQMRLAELDEDGQLALQESKVLILGAGGLSSPVALYLAAAGIGTIGLVDGDLVSLSNLQRQILFESSDENKPKVEQAKLRLKGLNPSVEVKTYPEFLTAHNALRIAEGYDLIIDGSDNFETKFLANDLAAKLSLPLVYASILRWQGEASVFYSAKGPCYRCLYSEKPEGHVPNCAEAGVIGALAGVLGSVQAIEAIKVLLYLKTKKVGLQQTLVGRIYRYDALNVSSKLIHLEKDPDCKICSQSPSELTLPHYDLRAVCDLDQREIFPSDLSPFFVLDVREEDEWKRGRLPGAEHWALSRMVAGDLPAQSFEKPYLIYCQAGVRSKKAIRLLEDAGWDLTSVRDLRGGFAAWAARAGQGK